MKKVNLLLFALFLSSSLWAQHQISGTIIDPAGQPVEFANVVLYSDIEEALITGTTTEGEGTFQLENIPSGNYLLKISMIGYTDQTQDLEVKEDLFLGSISLAEGELLEEVSVVAKKPVFESKIDRLVVNVQNAVSSSGGNALEILEKSPGIQVDRANNTLSMMGKGGVIVAINGKRTRLSNDALIQMLASMPASNIERIELITNPPSSYDAEGDAGVINIIMIQSQEEGLNGNFNLFTGYGQRPKFGGGLNMNFRKGRTNLYGSFTSNNDFTQQNIELIQRIQYADQLVDSDQFNDRPAFIGNHDAKLGLDVQITDQLEWSGFVAGSMRIWEMDATSTTRYNTPIDGVYEELLTSTEENLTDHFMLSNRLAYTLRENQLLSFDYDYLLYRNNNPTDYELSQFDEEEEALKDSKFSSNKITPFDFHVFKTDFETPLGEDFQFQTGLKLTLSNVQNDTRLTDFTPEPVANPMFTDVIHLDEEIYAAYASVRGSLGEQFSFSGGLRFEYLNLQLDSDNLGKLTNRKNGRLFPTINLTRKISENNSITLSYNARISRPGFQTLAPAFYFFDINTVLSGNINALPTISRTAGINLMLGTVFLNLAYTDEDRPITWGQPQLNEEDNVLVLLPRNFSDRDLFSVAFNFPVQFTKFWSSRYNVNGMWRREVPFADGSLEITSLAAFANMTQTFQFGNGWQTELSGRYNTPIKVGLSTFKERLSLDLGVQKTFDNQAKLALTWIDLFDNGTFFGSTTVQEDEGVFYDFTYQLEGNIVRLSFSMPFGNTQLKTKGPRKAGSEDIRQRADN